MIKHLFELLAIRLFEENPNSDCNSVLWNVPKQEVSALINGLDSSFSVLNNEGFSYQFLQIPLGEIENPEEFTNLIQVVKKGRGIVFVDGIATANRIVFECFRTAFKEPHMFGFAPNWVMLSFWDDQSFDKFDDGIASAVSAYNYSDLVRDCGSFVSFFSKASENK